MVGGFISHYISRQIKALCFFLTAGLHHPIVICQVSSCSLNDPMSWSTFYPLMKTNIKDLTKHAQGYTASMWSLQWDSRPVGLLAWALALHLKEEALPRCALVYGILKSQGRFVCGLVMISSLCELILF